MRTKKPNQCGSESVAGRRRQQRRERAFGLLEALESRTLMSAAPHAAPITELAAPASLVIKTVSKSSVLLNWTDKDANAAGYYVLRSTGVGGFTQIGQVSSAKGNSYTDGTVAADTAYRYEVQAYYNNVISGVSNAAAAQTPLIAASGLAAGVASGTEIDVTWTDNDPTAAGNYVLRSTDGTHFSVVGTAGGTDVSYADTSVTSGHTYTYEIEAFNGSVTAVVSNKAVASTPLGAPSNVNTNVMGPTKVGLTWTDNDPDAGGYYILRGTDGAKFAQIAKLAGEGVAAYTDASALSFHQYYYEVEAYNGTIVSAPSAAAGAVTPMAPAAGLVAKATGPTKVQLTWTDKEPGAVGYDILRSTDGVNFSVIGQAGGAKAASYTDSTVSSDTMYVYEVAAYNGGTTSAVSNAAGATTPLFAPSALVATAESGTDINLMWTENDPNAAGDYILRATDGKHFSVVATVGQAGAGYDDTSVTSGHTYTYEVESFNGNIVSAASGAAAANTPLAAPSNLNVVATSPTKVSLTWTDNDPDASGYYILRSTDDVKFAPIAKLSGAGAAAYADVTALSFHQYYYEVEAYNGSIVSAPAAAGAASTPMAPATGLVARAISPTTVQLTWTDKEPGAAGYDILRSTDGVNFTQIGQAGGAKAASYTDSTASSDTMYVYEVQAYNGGTTSAVSNAAGATTPLMAPSGLSGTAASGTEIDLTWTDNDPSAGGYVLLRSTDNKHFSPIGMLAAGTNSYADTTVASGHTYYYVAEAVNGNIGSVVSNTATVSTPLGAPSNVTATANSPTSVALTWTDNDTNAAGYYILRSTNGVNFTVIAKPAGAGAHAYTDNTAASGHTYYYEVEAVAGTIISAPSSAAMASTPLVAPISLAAKIVGTYVDLSWTDKDSTATGYLVFSSTDGVNFTQIAQLTSGSASGYADTTTVAGQTYYYKVQATNSASASAITAALTVTVPQGNSSGVTITTRYGNELVITASGTSDSVSITESGSMLNIFADGQNFSDAVPLDGVFVYTRGGADSVTVDSSVTVAATVDSIDGATTFLTSSDASLEAWVDSTDTFSGVGIVHKVASFAGGVTKALGASLKNPSDAGATTKVNLSLFGAGPTASDVNQGEVGDCYFLSSLAAFAGENPSVLVNSAVDLGDGTLAVQFYSNGNPVFVRVNNSFSNGPFGGFDFAHPGINNTIWAMVFEKAFAYFRTGANTYNSINSGWMGEVYSDLGVSSTNVFPGSDTESAFYNQISTALADGEAVTFGTPGSAPDLVGDHAYTLISASMDGNGVTHYTVRNPWGVSGDNIENAQGYATLTFAQMQANFDGGVVATS